MGDMDRLAGNLGLRRGDVIAVGGDEAIRRAGAIPGRHSASGPLAYIFRIARSKPGYYWCEHMEGRHKGIEFRWRKTGDLSRDGNEYYSAGIAAGLPG